MKLKRRSTPFHHRSWGIWWLRRLRLQGNILSSLGKRTKITTNAIEGRKPEESTVKSNYVSITIDKDGTHLLPDEDGICLLAADIVNNIPAMPSPASFIYRVPARLRVVNVKKYEPRIVSIGPFHQGMKNLRITEEHKKWYLCDLVNRRAQDNTDGHDSSSFVQEIVKAVWKIEINARTCYAEKFDLKREEFIKMMILDSCFILELFYRYKEYQAKTKEDQELMHSKDPIFSAAWMVRTLQRDLVLLENQIPFIVLKSLFDLTKDPTHNWTLNELAFNFLDSELPTVLQSSTMITCKPFSEVESDNNITGNHLLDLIRNRLLRGPEPENFGVFPSWNFTQYSASDLKEFGVGFKKKENCSSLFDITFKESGVLEIPHFFYGEGVTILLPNLIALEQCHRQYTDHIASYAILLDSLINSKEDVKLLRGKGIIDVYWNEDEKIASEFNSLCKGVKIDAFYYDELCLQVRNYCGKRRHKWAASLTQNHFRTPWAIISIIAAFILLGLAITQTVFSIL